MDVPERVLRRMDAFQRSRPWLAFPAAVWKKFNDDQAGNLAALIAYFTFVSIFPLLLVLVTILGLTLQHEPAIRQQVLNSAFGQYPVIGAQLRSNVHSLHRTGAALAIGMAGVFLGARGVANAAQNAFNSVWAVPRSKRPGFPFSLLRSFAMIIVIGLGMIATTILSGLAGGAGHRLSGAGAFAAAVSVSLAANVGLFWFGFRLGTARVIRGKDLALGAVLAAAVWQVLQTAGGYVVSHQLAHSSSLYGVFGLVLGLIAWLYLQAVCTLYAVEASVVHARKLWPRSLFPPPLTDEDRRAYELYLKREERQGAGEPVEARAGEHVGGP